METLTPTLKQTAPFESRYAWSAPSHPVHDRSQRWYVVGAMVVLAFAVFGIATGAWSLSIVSVLFGVVYGLLRRSPPLIRSISIGERGFLIDGQFVDWTDCKRFVVIGSHAWTELRILLKGPLRTEIAIQTADMPVPEIRAYLREKLEEAPLRGPTLVDTIIHLCKL